MIAGSEKQPETSDRSKVLRLVEYMTRLASLRTKVVRDIDDYQSVLWLTDIPKQKGCFTQAWGRDEEYDPDVWIEIQGRREPDLPSMPTLCGDWIQKSTLRNKKELPALLPVITRQVENPDWSEGSSQPAFIQTTVRLEDNPDVEREWARYVKEKWLPWTELHNDWEILHKVYSKLFAIYQEQIRLGEEYELVLALGLLTWQTPTGHRVRRHLIVADAVLEFEAPLAKFTLRSSTDGAKPRPEFDMLDIEDQPARVEERAKLSLTGAEDDPWERKCVESVLQAIVHSIDATGEYEDSLESKDLKTSSKPVVEYVPALILRKRSTKGLTEMLKRIKERVENGEEIPDEFADLSEIRASREQGPADELSESELAFEGEVFFPKASNEEQRKIVDNVRRANGVLVQGPPGTGKSHTIANLISHLLATGQRTLITAKTPRALSVLLGDDSSPGLVPDKLRPLCINLLGSGPDERRSLEASVGGILSKNDEWNERRAQSTREKLEERLRQLREEKATVDRRLRDIREAETHSHSIAEGTYRGTAARIAEAVNRNRNAYEWFRDSVPLDGTCPLSESELRNALAELRFFTPEKRKELALKLPVNLPPPDRVAALFENETNAIENERNAAKGADESLADRLTNFNHESVQSVRHALRSFRDARQKLLTSPHSWMADALADVMSGNTSLWRELSSATKASILSVENMVTVADDATVAIPEGTNLRALYEDSHALKEHMEAGGKLGWGIFRPKLVKDRAYILRSIRINGRVCKSSDDLSLLTDVLRVRLDFQRAWSLWTGRSEKTSGPYTLQLHAIKSLFEALDNVLALEELIEKCRNAMHHCPTIPPPVWSDELRIDVLIASCHLALERQRKLCVQEEIRRIESSISSFVAVNDAHPVTTDLLEAIDERNLDRFSVATSQVQSLNQERERAHRLDEFLSKLRRLVPHLTDELKDAASDPIWDHRLGDIRNAWHWTQARCWIEEYIRQDDIPALAKRSTQIDDEINGTIAKLASLHAWSFCFSRLRDHHRRRMEAWQQAMRRLGKGTGKHAARHRREAQQHLNECREVVPAWVMPLHRVWDSVDPAPGMFDVIIVDEASQCGPEALPLFYLAKKVIVVGDDKQISPESGFIDKNTVFQLMEQFLYDFDHKDSFHRDASLFDHGKLRYGTRRITLREHFRCMPEIIRFSNDLSYPDTPLIPLRQYGPNRLSPLEHVLVSGGYQEGSDNRTINRPEAEAIVDKIAELCADNRYSDKTMGVIVLQGKAQADLIEGQLLKRLGPEEMERRRLVCGNSYSFQGDERDVIFLSLVAATNKRHGTFTKTADEQRFNVAVSRARDQMYLFHSVRCDDLSTSCLRRRLLEFFEGAQLNEIAGLSGEELERAAFQDNRSVVRPPTPFDSWFEVDVALELLRKGYDVVSQYEIAGKRIDLVIEGGNARLAIECDGDKWHGPDRYEADTQRQRQLERCGWVFFRVRESAFYADKEAALKRLWPVLEERDIFPRRFRPPDEGEFDEDQNDNDEEGEFDEQSEDFEAVDADSGKPVEEVSTEEIGDAILQALAKCPNQSCTINSITRRVLKELKVLTRGNPRKEFEKRVMRKLGILERNELIERYKAKNWRVRLLKERM